MERILASRKVMDPNFLTEGLKEKLKKLRASKTAKVYMLYKGFLGVVWEPVRRLADSVVLFINPDNTIDVVQFPDMGILVHRGFLLITHTSDAHPDNFLRRPLPQDYDSLYYHLISLFLRGDGFDVLKDIHKGMYLVLHIDQKMKRSRFAAIVVQDEQRNWVIYYPHLHINLMWNLDVLQYALCRKVKVNRKLVKILLNESIQECYRFVNEKLARNMARSALLC